MKRFLSSATASIAKQAQFQATTYNRPLDMVLVRGSGAKLYDSANNEYIDFTAGIAVTALGHSNPEITKIISDQAGKLLHSSNLYHNEWAGQLSEKIITSTKEFGGMHDASRVFLCNSGTEANEAALKFAKKYGMQTAKHDVIAFKSGFHGRSMGALSVTANPKYREPFGPLVPNVNFSEVGDLEYLNSVMSEGKTCGVIIEPIQGEGGVYPVDTQFLVSLKELCEKHDSLLIYDEIQCGLGRSGKLWAHAYLPAEAHPDMFTVAKALGNGYPVGATIINDKVQNILKVGDHGTTYGGNPMAARIGAHVVDTIAQPQFLEAVLKKGDKFKKALEKLQEKFPEHIVEIRGKGLILGAQFATDPSEICSAARHAGLLVITAGNNTVRFVPALTITDAEIEQGMEIFEQVLSKQLK